MTRFARAKGSKSSNEKVPEPATPWSELKKGMLEKHEKPSESTMKCVSKLKSQINKKTEIVWSTLESDTEDSLNVLKKHLEAQKKQKNLIPKNELHMSNKKQGQKAEKRKQLEVENINKKRKKVEDLVIQENLLKKIKTKKESNAKTEKEKVKKSLPRVDGSKQEKKMQNIKYLETKDLCNAVKEENTEAPLKALKKKKKLKVLQSNNSKEDGFTMNLHDRMEISEDGEGKNLKDKGEEFIKKSKEVTNNLKNTKKKKKKIKDKDKKKMKNFAAGKSVKNDPIIKINDESNVKFKGSKNYKSRDNKKEKFKTSINIGGEIVNLVKFQGYYIKKEDAIRLNDLKSKLIKEGIPASQIESVIRLERRRCEKSLARMKKNVCFQCRKPGHILSQCPEVTVSIDTNIGICYKCGSTEHKAFTCKVNQKEKYPFAECFICKEKGHIARECPDNPKGLYPKGGCCRLCGDVTHLKKDCPKRIAEIEENTLTLNLQDGRNVEGLEDEEAKIEESGNNQKKIVVF